MENGDFASGARMASSDVDDYPGGVRFLAVEEDPSSLTTLTEMLQRLGYQVTGKASPEEALRALRDNPEGFDLVMTAVHTHDGIRQGIDGFELLKHATKLCPVILFSDSAPVETVMRGIVGGACDFLTKPLHDYDVRHIWQHVLRRKLEADSGAAADADAGSSDVDVGQDDAARKRGSGGLDDSDEGDSDGSWKQGMTTKKNKFISSPDPHASSVVKADEQLRGTEDANVDDTDGGAGEGQETFEEDQGLTNQDFEEDEDFVDDFAN